MAILYVLLTLAFVAFIVEEFVLIKPVSTIAQSDPLSKRLELAALWAPAIGLGITAATVYFFGGLRLGGVVNAVGLALCIIGLGIRYWSRRTLGRFFTIGVVAQEGHRVVQSGPYKHVRHPGYLGLLLFYLGLPLMIGNWLGLLVLSLPSFVVFVWLISIEDAELAAMLGKEYQDYQKRSARLIPGIW